MNLADTLQTLAAHIGSGVTDLSFTIHLTNRVLSPHDFTLNSQSEDHGILFSGVCDDYQIKGSFVPERNGFRATLSVSCHQPFICKQIDSLSLTYTPGGSLDGWRIPTLGEGVESVGMIKASQLGELLGENPIQGTPGESKYALGSVLRGAFPNSRQPGLFLGTILPQNHSHIYAVEHPTPETLVFSVSTRFVDSFQPVLDSAGRYVYTSESTWVCASLPIRAAFQSYAEHLPDLAAPGESAKEVPVVKARNKRAVGWTSWDYYFSALTLDDILENADFIRHDPQLSQAVKYIVVDMGWEHNWGEWQPNYRFPGGLERLTNEISTRGFLPGIWTSPLIVHPLSYPGLRAGEMFVKDEYGDPWHSPEGGQYAVDPTHPVGQAFLQEIFTRLYRFGFRFFKLDFVSALVSAPRFHDSTQGPYGALASFFRLVRECVGPESHIMGCSLPEECGPGLSDSHRTGIDIHNQWTHVEWALDFYQFAYWQHNRISVNDPDFLVVRGLDTSLEDETNVLNPFAHHPNPPRWRRGPVFSLEEARTWASFVSITGGNLFMSDRLAMLNQAGLELVRKVFVPWEGSAYPLDLAEWDRSCLWASALEDESRLLIINWKNQFVSHSVDFVQWGLPIPTRLTDFWTEASIPVVDGCFTVNLAPHACGYFRMQKIQ